MKNANFTAIATDQH